MAEVEGKEPNRGGLRSRLPKLKGQPKDVSKMASKTAPDHVNSPLLPADSSNDMTSAQPASDEQAAPQEENAPHEESASNPFSQETQFQYLEYLVGEFQQMQSDLQKMHRLMEEVGERESAQEKIFNTLHSELRDYKNDFIYEHLKPVVRPLLFLYDSLEQFDAEIALYEREPTGERRQVGLSPQLVRENIAFFRDQLVESLRICEVAPMESPKGAFNPRMHKVIDVVPVEAAQDGMIQRVVRSGWYLNGQLLRSAEVIVGKKMA